MKTFKDKVVLITGGNSGIGFATAKEFIAQGARVIITGKRREALEAAATETGAKAILSDQSKLQNIDNLVTEIKTSYGKIDVLFINAGVAFFAPVEFTTENQFDTIMNVNFKGSFFMFQKFIPLLNEGASVILVATNNTAFAMPGSAVYAASKAALTQLSKTAAIELAPKKIRVNTIHPGPTDTEMQGKFGMDEATLQAATAGILSQVPLAKLGKPEDVAKMALYLSDNAQASFITGAEFFIDGGMAI
jgi:NAD(P)-dependent dehydrogenase (short-subunit alcohol dehydrogenase family)